MRRSKVTTKSPRFVRRALVAAMCLPAGQALAGNSYDMISDYYASKYFDEIPHERFVELIAKSEGDSEIARDYASKVSSETESDVVIQKLTESMANLISNAQKLIEAKPHLIFVVHKALKDSQLPEPLVIDALYKAHQAYDKKFQQYAAQRLVDKNRSIAQAYKKPPEEALVPDQIPQEPTQLMDKRVEGISVGNNENLVERPKTPKPKKVTFRSDMLSREEVAKEKSVAEPQETSVGTKNDSTVDTEKSVFQIVLRLLFERIFSLLQTFLSLKVSNPSIYWQLHRKRLEIITKAKWILKSMSKRLQAPRLILRLLKKRFLHLSTLMGWLRLRLARGHYLTHCLSVKILMADQFYRLI